MKKSAKYFFGGFVGFMLLGPIGLALVVIILLLLDIKNK